MLKCLPAEIILIVHDSFAVRQVIFQTRVITVLMRHRVIIWTDAALLPI